MTPPVEFAYFLVEILCKQIYSFYVNILAFPIISWKKYFRGCNILYFNVNKRKSSKIVYNYAINK